MKQIYPELSSQHLLFVYGTLRREFNHRLYQRVLNRYAHYLGEATFRGKLYDLGSYPGAVDSPHPEDKVVGEVYAVEPEYLSTVLDILDEYEGCHPAEPEASLYVREQRPVHLGDQQIEAWIYLYNRSVEGREEIPGGDYVAHVRRQDKLI